MRALWQGLWAGIEHALIQPVVVGHPQLRGIPRPMRAVLICSLGLSVILLVSFMVVYYAVDESAGVTIVDRAPQWFAPILCGWTFTLAFAAAPTLTLGWRILAWVLLGAATVPMVASLARLSGTPWGPALLAGALLGIPLLVLGSVLGVRRPGGTWHMLGCLIGAVLVFIVPLVVWLSWDLPAANSLASTIIEFYTTALLLLGLPMLMAGALSYIQVSIEVAHWSVTGLRQASHRLLWVILALAVIAGGVSQLVSLIRFPQTLSSILTSLGLFVVGTALIAVTVRLARRRGAAERPWPSTMMDHFGGWVAVWGTAIFAGSMVYVVTDVQWAFPLLVTLVGLWAVPRSIRRRQPAAAAVHTAVFGTAAWLTLSTGFDLPRILEPVQTVVLLVIVTVVAVVARGQGRLSDTRLLIATIAAVTVALFPWRHLLVEPFRWLGDTHIAVIMIGVLWLGITAAAHSHHPKTQVRSLLRHAFVFVATATTIVVNPIAVGTLGGFDDAEALIARLMVPAVLVVLWEAWLFGVDPAETLPASPSVRNEPAAHPGTPGRWSPGQYRPG